MGLTVGFFNLQVAVIVAVGISIPILLLLSADYRYFWFGLITILFGYQFFGKGFAYIGVFPIFVSEAVIALGILTLIMLLFLPNLRVNNLLRLWVVYPLLLFLSFSILRTIPYLSVYKIDSIRDAMIYGYAVYAILIGLIIPKNTVENFIQIYQKLILIFLLLSPFILAISNSSAFPLYFPGSPVPFIYNKPGDMGVHLAGIAAFMLLRLDRKYLSMSTMKNWMYWFLWIVAVAPVVALNRGAFVSIFTAITVVLFMRPLSTSFYKPLVLGIFVICMVLIINGFYSFKISVPGHHREVSVEQIVTNVSSLVGRADNNLGGVNNTTKWRLLWWGDIIDYTFNGSYFWAGKGYGINLATADGYQVDEDESLRSPHNGFMTILGRSGVTGLLLWFAFLISYFSWLAYISLKARLEEPMKARLAVWFIAYGVAMLINTNFDVYLEGPMGGIWFWSMIGMSFAHFGNNMRSSTKINSFQQCNSVGSYNRSTSVI
jgi:hypothetical protein